MPSCVLDPHSLPSLTVLLEESLNSQGVSKESIKGVLWWCPSESLQCNHHLSVQHPKIFTRSLAESLRVFSLPPILIAASVLLKQIPFGDNVPMISTKVVFFTGIFHCSQTLNYHYIECQETFPIHCPCTCYLVGLIQTSPAFIAAEITDGQGDLEISWHLPSVYEIYLLSLWNLINLL